MERYRVLKYLKQKNKRRHQMSTPSFFDQLKNMQDTPAKKRATGTSTKVNLPKLKAELASKQERLAKLEKTYNGRLEDNAKTELDIKDALIEKSIIDQGIEALRKEPEANEFLDEFGIPKFLASREEVCQRIIDKGMNTIARRNNSNATTKSSIDTLSRQIEDLEAQIGKLSPVAKTADVSTDTKQK